MSSHFSHLALMSLDVVPFTAPVCRYMVLKVHHAFIVTVMGPGRSGNITGIAPLGQTNSLVYVCGNDECVYRGPLQNRVNNEESVQLWTICFSLAQWLGVFKE